MRKGQAMSDVLYGQCPHCFGSMTHRATDGKCSLLINTLDMTDQQKAELAALVARATKPAAPTVDDAATHNQESVK
jgi:hypothetical protein